MNLAGRVLVVDDQVSNTEALAQALEPLGYEVWQALDGPTALLLAKDRNPDVILLDLRMPGMDGFEVCRRLKADPETRLLPVVVLTGLDSRDVRLAALEAGATDFLAKPFDLVELEVRVRNLVSYRRLIQDLDDAERMLFAVARAVEARDEGTGEHCDRLSHLSVWLGHKLGLGEEELKALRRAGYLHDIGKIGIPDAILHKPGPLTAEEWVVMRSHVEIGVHICSPLRTLRPVLPIIRHHHERRDGSGYPDGLRGDQIPYLARVFQVVDVFDALTSNRPYRKALAPAQAVGILREETAKGYWDPEVVEVFARSLEAEGFTVPTSNLGGKEGME
ncbi:MAG: HD domain-containing phosphohydrolase [Thermoanaerobaculum sp.]